MTYTFRPDCFSLCIAEFLEDMILRDSLGIVPSNLTDSGNLFDSTLITSFKSIFSHVGVFLSLNFVYFVKLRFFGWVSIRIFSSSVRTPNWVRSFHSISTFALNLPSLNTFFYQKKITVTHCIQRFAIQFYMKLALRVLEFQDYIFPFGQKRLPTNPHRCDIHACGF